MSMTKKDYEAFATAIGRAFRMAGFDRDAILALGAETGTRGDKDPAVALFNVVNNIMAEMQQANPRFDDARFTQWVFEVADGTRYMGTGKRAGV